MAYQDVTIYAEIEATVCGRGYRADYGVYGSPVWTEYDVTGIDLEVKILGVTVKVADLPEALQEAIKREAYDNVFPDDWVE